MKIGITGTRNPITQYQKDEVARILSSTTNADELHHGDCVGADLTVAEIAAGLGYRVVCHPPVKDELRAFHESTEIRTPHSYFARNRNIVDECDVLLVVPWTMSHQNTGGTWYTHDYAVKHGVPVIIIWPEGTKDV